jgi:hypothetical protein
VPRRAPDRAAELAEIEAKYKARCDEIKAERARYGEWYDDWLQRRRRKALEARVPLDVYLRLRAGRGPRPMTPAEADAKQADLLREAREEYLLELRELDLKTRLRTGGAGGLSRSEVRSLAGQVVTELDKRRSGDDESSKRGPKRIEVSSSTKRHVAELRIAGTSVAEIMRQARLIKTVATRLVRDLDDALGRIRSGRY